MGHMADAETAVMESQSWYNGEDLPDSELINPYVSINFC